MSLFVIDIYKSIGKLFWVQRYYEGLILGTAEPVKVLSFLGVFRLVLAKSLILFQKRSYECLILTSYF